jgi:FKBP-type peptidyl-prolyl cis-trans isomerase FklB
MMRTGPLLKLPFSAIAAAAVIGSAFALAQEPTKVQEIPKAQKIADPAAPGILKDVKSKVSYGFGLQIGKNFKKQGVELDTDLILKGMKDGFAEAKALLTDAEIEQAMIAFRQEMDAARKKVGETFLADNAKKEGVKTTASGLQYKVIKEGAGTSPKATDEVTVHYEGKLTDGTVFDSSRVRNQPSTFRLNQVISGWTEGLQLMKPGAIYEFVIPSAIAYGAQGRPPQIPPDSPLVFNVELLAVGGGK